MSTQAQTQVFYHYKSSILVYRKVVNGRENLWDEYCRLHKEVKQLVIEKKLNIWNELVEKVNTDFNENRKEFWAFVGAMEIVFSGHAFIMNFMFIKNEATF